MQPQLIRYDVSIDNNASYQSLTLNVDGLLIEKAKAIITTGQIGLRLQWSWIGKDAECSGQYKDVNRVATRTGKAEKWEGIFQSGKSQVTLNRWEMSENHTQYWKIQEISNKCYLLFLVILNELCIIC